MKKIILSIITCLFVLVGSVSAQQQISVGQIKQFTNTVTAIINSSTITVSQISGFTNAVTSIASSFISGNVANIYSNNVFIGAIQTMPTAVVYRVQGPWALANDRFARLDFGSTTLMTPQEGGTLQFYSRTPDLTSNPGNPGAFYSDWMNEYNWTVRSNLVALGTITEGGILLSDKYGSKSVTDYVSSKSNNWDSAYSWVAANSNSVSYLASRSNYWNSVASYVSAKSNNWDTAYSWGNHASSGYLKADGTVSMLGNLNFNNRNITNIAKIYFNGAADGWYLMMPSIPGDLYFQNDGSSSYNMIWDSHNATGAVQGIVTAYGYATTNSLLYINSRTSYWNNVTAYVSARSNYWDSVTGYVSSRSNYWDSVTSYVSAKSNNWDSVTSYVSAKSNNWDTSYSWVSSNSNKYVLVTSGVATNLSSYGTFTLQQGASILVISNSTANGLVIGNGIPTTYSVFVGPEAAMIAPGAGSSVFVGLDAGYSATNAFGSVFVGRSAGGFAPGAHYSVFLGSGAGDNSANSANSIFIGYNAGQNVTRANTLIIDGNDTYSTTTNALIYGEFDNRMVRINGSLQVTNTIAEGGIELTNKYVSINSPYFNGHAIPSGDGNLDLGSPSHQWRDLYMTGTSIYMAGVKVLSYSNGVTMIGGILQTTNGINYVSSNDLSYVYSRSNNWDNSYSWVVSNSNNVSYLASRSNSWDTAVAEANYSTNWIYTWGPTLASTTFVNTAVSYLNIRSNYWDTVTAYVSSKSNNWDTTYSWVSSNSNNVSYLASRSNSWDTAVAEANYSTNWIYTWGPTLASTTFVNTVISYLNSRSNYWDSVTDYVSSKSNSWDNAILKNGSVAMTGNFNLASNNIYNVSNFNFAGISPRMHGVAGQGFYFYSTPTETGSWLYMEDNNGTFGAGPLGSEVAQFAVSAQNGTAGIYFTNSLTMYSGINPVWKMFADGNINGYGMSWTNIVLPNYATIDSLNNVSNRVVSIENLTNNWNTAYNWVASNSNSVSYLISRSNYWDSVTSYVSSRSNTWDNAILKDGSVAWTGNQDANNTIITNLGGFWMSGVLVTNINTNAVTDLQASITGVSNRVVTLENNVLTNNYNIAYNWVAANSNSVSYLASRSNYWDSVTAYVSAKSNNWDTAYSWGNHASGGYLKADGTVAYTATQNAGGYGVTNLGNLLPSGSNTVDVGSAALPFRDIYLGTSSVYMAGTKVMSFDPTTGNALIPNLAASVSTVVTTNSGADGTNWVCSTLVAPWSVRYFHNLVTYNNSLWMIAGVNAGGGNFNDVWSSIDGTNWTQATANAEFAGRYDAAVTVHNGLMWLSGGAGAATYNDVWYSSNGTNWTAATTDAGWSVRKGHIMVSLNGLLWVYAGDSSTDDVWYSANGTNWVKAVEDAGWNRRLDAAGVSYKGKMWFFGGINPALPHDDAWSSSDGTNWAQVVTNAPWGLRDMHKVVEDNGRLWLMGGVSNGQSTNDLWYSDNGISWTQAAAGAGWRSRSELGAAVLNHKLWMAGGYPVPGSGPTNDVWYTTLSYNVTNTVAASYATQSEAATTTSRVAAVESQTNLWNIAYGWGNHASAGYARNIRTVETKTDNYNVLTNDVAKTIVMDTAAKTNFLPSVTTSDIGIWYTFVKHNAGTLTIKAADSDIIADSGAGATIYDSQATEVYATITLQLISETNWVVTGAHGTWTTTD